MDLAVNLADTTSPVRIVIVKKGPILRRIYGTVMFSALPWLLTPLAACCSFYKSVLIIFL